MFILKRSFLAVICLGWASGALASTGGGWIGGGGGRRPMPKIPGF
ncbi:hypothetical protein WDW86_09150 [Bdellovibrionota bacterium FG-2]